MKSPALKLNQTGALSTEKPRRLPVVVIMGHIDHGKSTLLDYLRQTKVAAGEAGGITQTINAYETPIATFIDTPGHDAFINLRACGAAIADLAILVISAEDGVKPQTVEALQTIRQAKLPFIIAINKMDKPTANSEKIKQQLAEQEVLVEGYGGTIPVAEISAKTGQGVPELLELLNLVAEMEEFTADFKSPATGYVLETQRCPQSGCTAILIIKNGTLALGDWLVINGAVSKVKNLRDFLGQNQKTLSAAAPAQVSGFPILPEIGAVFQSFKDKKTALAAAAKDREIVAQINASPAPNVEPTTKILIPVLIKAAVAGSLAAMEKELKKVTTEAVGIKIIAGGVGQITENDVKLAGGTPGAIIFGFDVCAEKSAQILAAKLGVTIQTENIIYKLSEWLATEIAKRTPQKTTEEILGRAKLLKIFGQERQRQIVGGVVIAGHLQENKAIKIRRRETEIGRGQINGLQQQKIKVKEVAQDKQFGALVETKIPLAIGDVLEVFDLVTK